MSKDGAPIQDFDLNAVCETCREISRDSIAHVCGEPLPDVHVGILGCVTIDYTARDRFRENVAASAARWGGHKAGGGLR